MSEALSRRSEEQWTRPALGLLAALGLFVGLLVVLEGSCQYSWFPVGGIVLVGLPAPAYAIIGVWRLSRRDVGGFVWLVLAAAGFVAVVTFTLLWNISCTDFRPL